MRRVSEKREEEMKQRRAFVEEQLGRRQFCEAVARAEEAIRAMKLDAAGAVRVGDNLMALRKQCSGYATELHEPLTRARAPGIETITDVKNSVAICPGCHRWTHDHPAFATEFNLLVSAYPLRRPNAG
jgi:hypothetical protein